MLAKEIWAFENSAFRKESVLHNRKFIEENADYKINMKIAKYHELIDSAQNDLVMNQINRQIN
jgi:uncharacterized protein YozE (UPF0346 family)